MHRVPNPGIHDRAVQQLVLAGAGPVLKIQACPGEILQRSDTALTVPSASVIQDLPRLMCLPVGNRSTFKKRTIFNICNLMCVLICAYLCLILTLGMPSINRMAIVGMSLVHPKTTLKASFRMRSSLINWKLDHSPKLTSPARELTRTVFAAGNLSQP